MPQHQVPQQHPAQQLPQQQQQYPNMSWHQEPPKAAPSDSWGSWHNQQQQPPQPSNNATQNYAAYGYGQQQAAQAHSSDPWSWGADDTQQASVQQHQQHNNNIDQSFQNDSSWNWSMDQSAPSQNSVNYYQMGYGGQLSYTDQNVNTQAQLSSNNNLGYSEAPVEHNTPLNVQDMTNVNQFSEPIKVEGEEYKTEQPVETSERYEDQLEPAMSETSKNSMTPQWSIESQVSQDSDDISSSIGQTTSQAKSEDSGQHPPGYLSGDAQNLWDDTEDEDDLNERNVYLEQAQESITSAPLGSEIDRHSKLNLDETISALEGLKMTADTDVAAFEPTGPLVAPQLRPPSVPTESAPKPSVFPPPSGGPPANVPPPTSMLPPPGGPPASLSSTGPPAGMPPSGSNPYSVNRSGMTHKSASKQFSGSGMSRQLFAPPLQPGGVPENNQVPQEAQPRVSDSQTGAVENRSQEPPAGQEFGSADLNAQIPLNSWAPQDNHDVAPRFGLDRNQYLETGQLTSQTSEEESAPPPGLHRLVTGQLTEQDSQVSTPPPGLDRMIPGQITERDGMRMVPGRMAAADDDDDDDDFNDNDLLGMSSNVPRSASRDPIVEHSSNLRRMVPGQTDSQEEEDEMPNISAGPSDLPPGLHRMVPGESSSPESQSNIAVGLQSSEMNSAFQPIEPREPRVVTGVAMESIPPPVVAPSPQQSIKVEPTSSSPDDSHETRGAGIAQPPSERSETIGSDGVDEKAADNPTKKSERRSRDDADSDRDEREPRGRDRDRDRDYYRRDRDEDRDGDRSMSPSESGSNRYRDDRDRDRRYDSPEGQGRSRYRGDRDRDRRARDKDGDYDPERRYDTRRDRDRDHRDRTKRDESGEKEGRRRGYNREEDEGESEDYGSDREERKWSRDRDADRDRNREGDRDRERERYRERDRFRDRDGYRDRDRERDRADRSYGEDYYRRERRGRDEPDKVRRSGGRRSDDYHRGYDDDYYRDRRSSRPSSRSGSVHEYGHAYERDYRDDRHERSDRNAKHNQYYPGGYYYNPQEYYRYQMYYTNLRKTDPEAYAAWYRKYYSQYAASQPGTYEDRGSVHSGRSSANEELNNQRGVGHGESSLDETNSSIQRLTPFKFSTAHVKGILTRGGHLLKVVPSYPLDGQSATVEVHSMQSLIPQDQNLHDLLALPGPLVRGVTHKKTIILYLRSKMESTRNDPAIYDWQSVVLLYELLILLLRQNGMIVGTDIAELLLRNGDNPDADDSWSTDHRAQSTPSPAPSGGSRTSSASATPAVQVVNTSVSQQPKLSETEITNKFREFLLYGNTKEALEWAMKHGLWGHALFLSSKLDQRMYHSVMTRFANGLALTDPIQTLYQLLSGWQPAAVTCVADDKWGDWRPHLAMILSNTSSRPEIDHKAIMALGDTLSARGCLHASHFCYLMAQHPFGTYSQRTSKYVLLGSSHLRSFAEFASNEAIMITCIYEYARSLADPNFHIPNLQPYKYLMATRLVEANLLPDAVHYCEVVSKLIVQNRQQYETSFVRDVEELSESLKFHDPFYSAGGDLSAQGDPDWLLQLRSVSSNNSTYSNYSNYGESYANASYGALQGDTVHDQASISSHSMDPAMYGQEMPHQHVSAEPQQELVHQHEEQQPQLPAQTEQLQQQSYYYQDQQPWSLQEGHQQQTVDPNSYSTDGYGNVETDQSGWWNGQQEEVPSISMDSSAPMVSGQTNREPMQEQPVQVPKPTPSAATVQPSSSSPPSQPTASAKTANRQPTAQANTQSNSSWFGGLWNKLALRPKNQMKLPDDKNPSIVWDDQKKRWVNVDGDGEEEGANLAPPPKMSEMPGRFAPPGPGLTPGPGAAPGPGSAPGPGAALPSNVPSVTPVVANGTAGMAFNTPTSSTVPSANEGENVGVKGPNMFKLPRGRSLRASYVDVMNPNGTKASGPNSLPPPNLFPTSASQPSSLNYFVPATVEGNENAPTDFLTPAPALIAPSESAPDQQPVQAGPGGPQMFNPAQFSQQSFTSSAPRKRYAN